MKEVKISLNEEQIAALKEGKLKLALVDANSEVSGGSEVTVAAWAYATNFVPGK